MCKPDILTLPLYIPEQQSKQDIWQPSVADRYQVQQMSKTHNHPPAHMRCTRPLNSL